MHEGWRTPARWARSGALLLAPYAVLVWFTLVPTTLAVIAFAIAMVGVLGVVAAVVVVMLRIGRVSTGVLGTVLFLAGLALFGLDPFPGDIPGIGEWWPSAITQPQIVGTWYWTVVALAVFLTGIALLVALLVVALTGRSAGRSVR